MNVPVIETPRLILREWLPEDTEPFIAMNQDKDVMEFFPNLLTVSETLAMIERIKQHFSTYGFGLYAIEDKTDKQFIGFTGLSTITFQSYFTPCIEVGWRLKKNAWGKGFATEAAQACLTQGFEALQLDKIVSFTATINHRSEKVMQRIGMTLTGQFDHPRVPATSILCRHVLYEITAQEFQYRP